jgi:carbon monoxide dehydrogenase subunit G
MTKIDSNPVEIQSSAKNVLDFLSNFDNFSKLMPPQIVNWQSTADSCSFTIQNMATLAMRIQEKESNRLVIVSEAPSPFPFQLICELDELSENNCRSTIRLHAEMNMMVAMMAKNPLQNFVNILNEQLKQKIES